jgi:hypothetical protein
MTEEEKAKLYDRLLSCEQFTMEPEELEEAVKYRAIIELWLSSVNNAICRQAILQSRELAIDESDRYV